MRILCPKIDAKFFYPLALLHGTAFQYRHFRTELFSSAGISFAYCFPVQAKWNCALCSTAYRCGTHWKRNCFPGQTVFERYGWNCPCLRANPKESIGWRLPLCFPVRANMSMNWNAVWWGKEAGGSALWRDKVLAVMEGPIHNTHQTHSEFRLHRK